MVRPVVLYSYKKLAGVTVVPPRYSWLVSYVDTGVYRSFLSEGRREEGLLYLKNDGVFISMTIKYAKLKLNR